MPPPDDRRAFLGALALGAAAASAEAAAPPTASKLTEAGEAQLRALLARLGDQLTAAQKADLRPRLLQVEKDGRALRAYPLDENSEPALLFRVWRKEG